MIRYFYMEQNRPKYRIAKMAQWLQVSKSGYYAWRKRPQSFYNRKRIHEANGYLTPEEPERIKK